MGEVTQFPFGRKPAASQTPAATTYEAARVAQIAKRLGLKPGEEIELTPPDSLAPPPDYLDALESQKAAQEIRDKRASFKVVS